MFLVVFFNPTLGFEVGLHRLNIMHQLSAAYVLSHPCSTESAFCFFFFFDQCRKCIASVQTQDQLQRAVQAVQGTLMLQLWLQHWSLACMHSCATIMAGAQATLDSPVLLSFLFPFHTKGQIKILRHTCCHICTKQCLCPPITSIPELLLLLLF